MGAASPLVQPLDRASLVGHQGRASVVAAVAAAAEVAAAEVAAAEVAAAVAVAVAVAALVMSAYRPYYSGLG